MKLGKNIKHFKGVSAKCLYYSVKVNKLPTTCLVIHYLPSFASYVNTKLLIIIILYYCCLFTVKISTHD